MVGMPPPAAAVACCMSDCQSDGGGKNGVRSKVDFRTRRKKKVVPCAKLGLRMPHTRGPLRVPNEIKGTLLKASRIISAESRLGAQYRCRRHWVKNPVGRKSRSMLAVAISVAAFQTITQLLLHSTRSSSKRRVVLWLLIFRPIYREYDHTHVARDSQAQGAPDDRDRSRYTREENAEEGPVSVSFKKGLICKYTHYFL